MPNALWIWSVHDVRLLSITLQKNNVKFFTWETNRDVLWLGCSDSKLYLWSEEGVSIIHIPFEKFRTQSIYWNPNDEVVLLNDSNSFCLGYAA